MALQFHHEWQRIQRLCRQVRVQPKLGQHNRLTLTSGVLLTGAAMLGLLSQSSLGRTAKPLPFQESLWVGAGLVRQSVIDLYRIQRSQQQEAVAASPQSEQAPAAAPAQSAKPTPQPAAPAQPAPVQNVIDNALEMRVAISRNRSSLVVGVSTAGWTIDTDGTNHCDLSAQSSRTATPNSQGIDIGGCQLSGAVWLEAEGDGYVFIADSWFRGRVLLLNTGTQLLAVNFVQLGDYLASVVGSEMYHHWPLEAFKAQAVAARSYALTHHVRPASDYFDLDNTQRFQAYKGIAMETPGTQQAVFETAGEFISYGGGIVESLYAASDQIVQEAHGGRGMSQHGAKDYAAQGFRYDQILSLYYPGTELARLVVE